MGQHVKAAGTAPASMHACMHAYCTVCHRSTFCTASCIIFLDTLRYMPPIRECIWEAYQNSDSRKGMTQFVEDEQCASGYLQVQGTPGPAAGLPHPGAHTSPLLSLPCCVCPAPAPRLLQPRPLQLPGSSQANNQSFHVIFSGCLGLSQMSDSSIVGAPSFLNHTQQLPRQCTTLPPAPPGLTYTEQSLNELNFCFKEQKLETRNFGFCSLITAILKAAEPTPPRK